MTLAEVDNPAVGVIVGRFQSHELHRGHIQLFEEVISKHQRVLVFLGLSASKQATYRNPLDYVARKQMINERYPEVEVLYIKDVRSDKLWSDTLDKLIDDVLYPNQKCLLYGSRDGFQTGYLGKYPVKVFRPSTIISASELRDSIGNIVKGSADFRAGAIWASQNTYPKVHPAVDIAAVQDGKLLLAQKKNEEKFRFIGGFMSPDDLTAEISAQREFTEETGGATLVEGSVKYISSNRIDDWRYRSERDKITSFLFFSEILPGKEVEASDDIEFLHWVEIDSSILEKVMPEHVPLAKDLLKYLERKV